MNQKKWGPAFQKFVISKQGLVHFARDMPRKKLKVRKDSELTKENKSGRIL